MRKLTMVRELTEAVEKGSFPILYVWEETGREGKDTHFHGYGSQGEFTYQHDGPMAEIPELIHELYDMSEMRQYRP